MPLRKPNPADPETTDHYPGVDISVLPFEYQEMFRAIVREVISLRGAATLADLTTIMTATEAAEGEANARVFARRARDDNDPVAFARCTKLVESQSRSKQAALGRLGLAGERRGQLASKMAALATSQHSLIGTSKPKTGRWN